MLSYLTPAGKITHYSRTFFAQPGATAESLRAGQQPVALVDFLH
jgi:hypothetical protein